MATGAPEISLGQKYLTTFNPFGISNYGPDSIRDLISLTSPPNHHKLKKIQLWQRQLLSPSQNVNPNADFSTMNLFKSGVF